MKGGLKFGITTPLLPLLHASSMYEQFLERLRAEAPPEATPWIKAIEAEEVALEIVRRTDGEWFIRVPRSWRAASWCELGQDAQDIADALHLSSPPGGGPA